MYLRHAVSKDRELADLQSSYSHRFQGYLCTGSLMSSPERRLFASDESRAGNLTSSMRISSKRTS